MKKSLTRVLSLVLVLVMMLGVMPVVSAATADATIETNSAPYSFTVTSAMSDAPAHNYVWSTTGGTLGTTSTTDSPNNTFQATTAGTYTITCRLQIWDGSEIVDTEDYTYTIKVEDPKVLVGSVNIISDTYALHMTTKKTENLTPTVEGVGGETPTNGKLEWTVSPSGYVTLTPAANGKDCQIAAVKPTGDTKVVVTATAKDGSGKKDTCVVTVAAPTQTGIQITAAGGATKVGVEQDLVLTAEALPQYAELSGALNWTVEAGTGTAVKKSASGNSCTITGKSAGTITVKVTDGTHHASLGLTVENTSCTVTLSPETVALAKGETSAPLTVTVKDDAENTITSGYTVDLVPADATKVSANDSAKTLTGLAKGSTTVKAVVTYGGKTFESNTINVSVAEASITLSPTTMTVAVGKESDALTVTVKDENGTVITDTDVLNTITLTSDATAKATVDNTTKKVTGVAFGTANITAKFTYEGTEYTSNACAVTVSNGQIIEGNASYPVSTTKSYTLSPEYDSDNDGKADTGITGITYSYTKKAGNATLSDGKVSSSTGGWALVTITAKKDGTTLSTKDVYVSLYKVASKIELTMKDGYSELPFNANGKTVTGESKAVSAMITGAFDEIADEDEIHFSYSDILNRVGKLTGLYANSENWNYIAALPNMKFVVTGGAGGVWEFTYEILKRGTEDVILGQGAVKINFDGASNSIDYSTDYTKSVTVSESDFYKFWNVADTKNDLAYVKFNITASAPSYGDLYTSKNTTSVAYLATSSHSFAYGSYGDSTYKDLGSLTFVPLKTKTTAYTETIPFTMYGKTGEIVYGNLVFHVNENGSDITPRGIFFSSAYDTNGTTTTADDISFADLIANTYKDETGKELGHVVFTLPAAEDGALYSEIPASGGNTKVAEGARLRTGAELYYEKTTGKLRLQNAAFIPAAGKSGKITLSYTAYDTAGGSADSGTLVLNVKTKSASAVFSDVNAKNYSWASDSVDFLYYEGTAQGSNGKYNPSANITRRDFMLMLYRAFLAEDYGTFTVTSNFPDVVKGADSYSKEIYQAVGVAKYLGIAQGTNDRFNPTANITRQEAMVLIYRTLETINKDLRTESGVKLTSMKDYAKISSWATTAISNLVGHGVIKGNNDNIKPLDPISRAEMAAILHRVITY